MDSRAAQIYIGSAYFLLSAAIIPLYVGIIWVFITEPSFKNNFSYRIMTAIGLAQGIIMLISSVNGLMLISNCNFGSFFEKAIMAILEGAFNSSLLLLLVLAINRFYIFYAARWISVSTAKITFNVLVAISWLIGLFFTAILLSPYADLRFSLTEYGNQFLPADTVVSVLVLYCSTCSLAVAFVFYLITVVVIAKQRYQAQDRARSNEIRLFVQGILDFLFAIVMEVAFYFAPRTHAAMIGVEIAFILYNGYVNPIAYIVINRRIRNCLLKSIRVIKVRSATEPATSVFRSRT